MLYQLSYSRVAPTLASGWKVRKRGRIGDHAAVSAGEAVAASAWSASLGALLCRRS